MTLSNKSAEERLLLELRVFPCVYVGRPPALRKIMKVPNQGCLINQYW